MRPKKNLLASRLPNVDLKHQSKKMEDKLNQLKALMQKQKNQRNIAQRFSNTKPNIKEQPVLAAPQIDQFLKEIGLGQYYGTLLKSGIDSFDILEDVKKEELEEIGVLKGHAIKIMKHLKTRKEPQTANNFMQEKPQEEMKESVPGTTEQQKQREQRVQTNNKAQGHKKVYKTFTTFQDCQTEPYTQQLKPRLFCQKCYKQYQETQFEGFCSQLCENKYRQENHVTCEQCKRVQQRWQCYKVDEMFFCSDKCLSTLISRLEQEVPTQEQFAQQEVFWKSQEHVEEINTNQLQEIEKMLGDVQ